MPLTVSNAGISEEVVETDKRFASGEIPFQRLQRSDGTDTSGAVAPGIYEAVIEQIKSLLRERHYQPGDKLPSERDLSEKLGVNRHAIREGARALTLMGVIQTRPQSGSHFSTNVDGMLRLPFEFLMLMLRPSYDEIQELRGLIEVYAAGRAAMRRTDEDLLRIEEALETMRRTNEMPHLIENGGAPNRRFHRTIAAATHNRLLEYVLFCLLEARSAYIRSASPGNAFHKESLAEHERLLQAIRVRDSNAAEQAMRDDMRVASVVGKGLES